MLTLKQELAIILVTCFIVAPLLGSAWAKAVLP